LFRSLVKAEDTYICSLNNVKGTYYIAVSATDPVDITVLLFKNSLTHISPSANHLFDNEGIFELPTNDQKVMV